MKNLRKLNRNQQKEIKGAGLVTKCKNSSQCGFGECCSGGMCIASDIPNCEPIE